MKKYMIIIGIIALVVGAVIIIPAAIDMFGLQGDSGNIAVQFYNDGTPVGTPFGFQAGGQDVDEFIVTITFSSDGPDVDWSTFSGSGTIKLFESEGGRELASDTWTHSGSQPVNEKRTFTYVLISLFPSPVSGKSYIVEIQAQMSATVGDSTTGSSIERSWVDGTEFGFTYAADEFTLTGSVNV